MGSPYSSESDASFKAFYDAAKASRDRGSLLVRWKAGDTEAERQTTLNWNDPNTWATINAEFCQRFPDKVGRPAITRTKVEVRQ